MTTKPEVLLDVHVEGMFDILRDLDWNVTTVTKLFGPTKEGRHDDKVVAHAQNNKNCVVVTQDTGLIKRCKALEIKVVGLEIDDLAKMVNQILKKDYG